MERLGVCGTRQRNAEVNSAAEAPGAPLENGDDGRAATVRVPRANWCRTRPSAASRRRRGDRRYTARRAGAALEMAVRGTRGAGGECRAEFGCRARHAECVRSRRARAQRHDRATSACLRIACPRRSACPAVTFAGSTDERLVDLGDDRFTETVFCGPGRLGSSKPASFSPCHPCPKIPGRYTGAAGSALEVHAVEQLHEGRGSTAAGRTGAS